MNILSCVQCCTEICAQVTPGYFSYKKFLQCLSVYIVLISHFTRHVNKLLSLYHCNLSSTLQQFLHFFFFSSILSIWAVAYCFIFPFALNLKWLYAYPEK